MKSRRIFLHSFFLPLALVITANCTAPVAGAPCPCTDDYVCSDDVCVVPDAQAGGLCPQGVAVEIEGNHVSAFGGDIAHRLVIPSSDVEAGEEVIYDMQGAANHTHEFRITPDTFDLLATSGTIMQFSSPENNDPDKHSHVVTVVCHEDPFDGDPDGPDGGSPDQ